MFTFGTPLISKAAAVDWDKTVALLNDTLGSLAQQTDKRFRSLIACHDIPEIREEFKPFVTYLPVDTPIPKEIMEMRRDKGRKKREIAMRLRSLGGGYLMILDADDLVHKDLVKYALEANAPHGYIVKNGYMVYSGAEYALPLTGDFNQQCGSCGIFRLNVEDLPKDVSDEGSYYDTFGSHRTWEEKAKADGRPMQAVPFPAVIYLRSPDITISGRFFPEIGWRGIKKQVKLLLKRRRITPAMRADFGLKS